MVTVAMTGLRVAGASLAVFVVVMGGFHTPDGGVVRAVAAPAAVLNLRLTAIDTLPAVSRRALIAEANDIWSQANIRLRWLSGSAAAPSGSTLRVLVVPQTVSATGEEPWAVAELLRFEQSQALAVASIVGAQRVVDASQHYRLIDLPAWQEHRLGLVLGRAVAHEIGHYLLQSNDHTPEGLMRATIAAQEFADPRAMTFRLDEIARARLAAVTPRP